MQNNINNNAYLAGQEAYRYGAPERYPRSTFDSDLYSWLHGYNTARTEHQWACQFTVAKCCASCVQVAQDYGGKVCCVKHPEWKVQAETVCSDWSCCENDRVETPKENESSLRYVAPRVWERHADPADMKACRDAGYPMLGDPEATSFGSNHAEE